MSSTNRALLTKFGIVGAAIPFVLLGINLLVTSSTTSYEIFGSASQLLTLFFWPSSVMQMAIEQDTTLGLKAAITSLSIGVNVLIYILVGWTWRYFRRRPSIK